MKYTLQTFLLRIPEVFLVVLTASSVLHAQAVPSIEWQKCLGGSDYDTPYSIQQLAGGGFIVAGSSESNDGDVSGNQGLKDYWIVKLDAAGNLLWQKSLGGSNIDEAHSIQQTADGGFIVAGESYSNDGDVVGHHDCNYYYGCSDYWILKLDMDGNLVWQKSLGGTDNDAPYSVQQTTDGGFIVAGGSYSTDGDISNNHGGEDYWVTKLDTGGIIEWQKSFGGSDYDDAFSVRQIADGGFIVAGESSSTGGDVTGNHGGQDYWIAKLDTAGNLVWQKSLGGSSSDDERSIQQTTDGGFIVAGLAYSNDGDVTGHHGSIAYADYWIVKLDTAGNLVWQKSLGGSKEDYAFSIQQTTDEGFIVAGRSASNNGDVSGNQGGDDCWIAKLDTVGNLVWQKSLGGSSTEYGISIQQTSDDGYIVAGLSGSNDGDVSGGHGLFDYWIVKLTSDHATEVPLFSNNLISVFPNPAQKNLIINLATDRVLASGETIRVYDLSGRLCEKSSILQTPLSGHTNRFELNIENLPAGFYTFEITNNPMNPADKTRESEFGKFVKQ